MRAECDERKQEFQHECSPRYFDRHIQQVPPEPPPPHACTRNHRGAITQSEKAGSVEILRSVEREGGTIGMLVADGDDDPRRAIQAAVTHDVKSGLDRGHGLKKAKTAMLKLAAELGATQIWCKI